MITMSFITPQDVHITIGLPKNGVSTLESLEVRADASQRKERLIGAANGFSLVLKDHPASPQTKQAWRAAERFCREYAEMA